MKEAIKSETVYGNISELCVAEVGYVFCRKLGGREARVRIKNLLDSGYFFVHDDSELIEHAAEYKCKRSLSLADCFTLALAKKIDVPALFAEAELIREISSEPFDVEILFLEDF
ncbi:MAG: PIN domain-containing protein [Candidatus Brockarchaeota archaeon]|nr:PIN domain-containing protein [Candidatus Brockarchaeota archaeon]MBO3808180.1 PIN domain-containing protein [Candidatus Brockarchaeota archaeon]